MKGRTCSTPIAGLTSAVAVCLVAVGTANAVESNADSSAISEPYLSTGLGIQFSLIADVNTPVPGNPSVTFTDFSFPSIDDDGNVAFFAFDSNQNEGVYTWKSGVIEVVADQSTLIPPANTDTFPGFLLAPGQAGLGSRQLSIDDGQVAFLAQIPDPSGMGVPTRGIYTNADTTVDPNGILEEVALGDNLATHFASNLSNPWLDGTTVAYGGHEVLVQGGVIGRVDTFESLGDIRTSWYTDTDFDVFHQPSLGGGRVTVETSLGFKQLRIEGSAGTDTVVTINTTLVPGKQSVPQMPVWFGNFSHFPVLDANSDIAFQAIGTDFLTGVYKRAGGVLQVVADTNTPIPGGPLVPQGGSFNFTEFDPRLAVADGKVLFRGFDGSGVGLYTDASGPLQEIVRIGDVINVGSGSFTVANLWIGTESFIGTPTGYAVVFDASLREASGTPFSALVRADINLLAAEALPDVNGNGAADIAVIKLDTVAGEFDVHVKDGETGDVITSVMSAGSPTVPAIISVGVTRAVDMAVAPDVNGNGAPEIAVLGIAADDSVSVRLNDTLTGDLIRTIPFAPANKPLAMAVVPDIDGGTTPAIAVLGIRNSDGKVRAQVKNAVTGALTRWVQFATALPPKFLVVIPDVSGNNVSELGVLGTEVSSGKHRVQVKDAATGALIHWVQFARVFAPQDLLVIPGVDGGTAAGLAVLGIRTDGNGQVRLQVKNAATRAPVNTVNYATPFSPVAAVAVPDLDGGGIPEVAVLGVNESGTVRAQIKDVMTRTVVGKPFFARTFPPRAVFVVDDLNGNAAPEVAVLGVNASGNHRVQIKDALTGDEISLIPVP